MRRAPSWSTTIAALVASRYIFGKVAVMPLVTAVFVVVFGGLTLYLQDEQFIKMKPTIVNAIFSGLLFAGLLTGRIFLKMVFGDVMRLTEPGWRKLTIRWGASSRCWPCSMNSCGDFTPPTPG